GALLTCAPLGDAFTEILQLPVRVVSPCQAVLLCNLGSQAYLMRGKALQLRISEPFPSSIDRDFFFRGSGLRQITAHEPGTSGNLKISFYPGEWEIKPHPPIDPVDPRYIPLVKRL